MSTSPNVKLSRAPLRCTENLERLKDLKTLEEVSGAELVLIDGK